LAVLPWPRVGHRPRCSHTYCALVSAPELPVAYVVALGLVAVLAGGVAAVSGFGIGSLLTPILALQVDIRLAVAAVSIPHLIGTAQRFWTMRRDVDRRLLLQFGVTSAIGGLIGALLHDRASNRGLTIIFGVLLLLAATADLTGWMRRVNWGPTAGWVAGAISGLLGGLVGNQGSIRTAGLLAYHVSPAAFVATATAVALFVDGARIPVYVATQGRAIAGLWPLLLVASCGVVIGTAIGTRVLRRLPEKSFRRSVALLLAALGVAMLVAASVRA
jgi:uncharacterized membrane protein YfcA